MSSYDVGTVLVLAYVCLERKRARLSKNAHKVDGASRVIDEASRVVEKGPRGPYKESRVVNDGIART